MLAYGQTGSGKTYTMGTGFELAQTAQQQGIIPRAVKHLFEGIRQRQEEAKEKGVSAPEFKVTAQFMELAKAVQRPGWTAGSGASGFSDLAGRISP